jgi:intracellular sulfur oxidation DsrE/DsrF family protein
VVRKVWIAFVALSASTMTIAAAQTRNQADEPTSGWTYPVIKDYGRAWPLPRAAVQPQKGRTYKVIFNLSTAAPNPNEVLPGLANAARLLNVFAADGAPPKNLKVVAIFHGSAGYAAMSNEVYRAKFDVDNPNLKIIQELKAAGVQMLLCGQTFHELNFNERDLLPYVKLATSAAIVLVMYQNDGYALMPF